jgi:hypothetical protein
LVFIYFHQVFTSFKNKELIMKKFTLVLLFGLILMSYTRVVSQNINPNDYPAATKEEWGQLLWNLKLADQDASDFTNYRSIDEQGVSASRYTVAFASYFLALEQYHKFPAWSEALQPAFDNLINRMLNKKIWGYWYNESKGITKFEPNMDRPYIQSADPVGNANIMYSGHLGMMINLYQMLYSDMKWDKPGSIVFNWDENQKFVYDNKSLQEVMFIQMMHNPVPGIECERNAVFPACNTHPMISWKLYDKMHNTRYYDAAHTVFDPWFEKVFINPQTKDFASFYLIKQGWAFSGWNPKYGNKMDEVMVEMVKKGVDFNSGGNDGWIGTFMHVWNPVLIEKNYPYLKKKHYKELNGGKAFLTKDVVAPDCYYGFFATLAAEVGDVDARARLLKTVDSIYSPVWIDGTFHYPFMDNVPTVNLAAADGEKKTDDKKDTTAIKAQVPTDKNQNPDDPKPSGLCCKSTQVKGHGDATNMKSFPSHSDLADRLIAIARATPAKGFNTMVNEPFDKDHFAEPSITGIDIKKIILKRAIYDQKKKALIISTVANSKGSETSFKAIKLNLAKTYNVFINNELIKEVKGIAEYEIKIDS